jgi:hypothetical protein
LYGAHEGKKTGNGRRATRETHALQTKSVLKSPLHFSISFLESENVLQSIALQQEEIQSPFSGSEEILTSKDVLYPFHAEICICYIIQFEFLRILFMTPIHSSRKENCSQLSNQGFIHE